ncbi:MAG: Glu-tRNA(Gln) amidotransferase subunit GatE [Methanosarcinales archaeon Met12]|nr:MAG: Glu-tRNA(Gln) amidotransferase subunit GatE [Methanosarcinales archaeon Met12]
MVDYRRLGLKAGLEVHQQLDTASKLFCGCPTKLRDNNEPIYEIHRHLHMTESELGEIDRAVLEEAQVRRRFVYKGYDTTCLVENDEEPPRVLNPEALEIALEVALLLNMVVVDETHTMRKIVIDGSNTSGFQRTALIASDGSVVVDGNVVRIDILCLEEEAAQRVSGGDITYSLDRLGIPLVEIGTAPYITTPKQARSVAEHIGIILRSTGKVKRGIGTIRQDINISIAEGARVEIKGVQTLNLIESIVENEVTRQVGLLRIRDELKKRGAKRIKANVIDVSDIFANTMCNALKSGIAMAVNLSKFGGLVGCEIQHSRRLGTEFSDQAKRFGVGGIFHTDEVPKYGITNGEVDMVRKKLRAGPDDCVVIAAGDEERVRSALNAVVKRANEALDGVPEETRRALPDGNSAYMRPLPGAARMYPETDVLPVRISEKRLKQIKCSLPELIQERKERYMKEYGLNEELAELITRSANAPLFERIMRLNVSPTLVVMTLEATTSKLKREGVPVQNLEAMHFIELFELICANKIAKEGILRVLEGLANNPDKTAEDIASDFGLRTLDRMAIESIIEGVVLSKRAFIKEKGYGVIGPLMGVVMTELRGKVDGKLVSTILKEKVSDIIKER